MIGAKAMLANLTVDHDVVKGVDVARSLPDRWVHHDGGIEGNDVVAKHDGIAPPRLFDVSLQHRAKRPVIPETVDSAVDLARLKDEAAALRQPVISSMLTRCVKAAVSIRS